MLVLIRIAPRTTLHELCIGSLLFLYVLDNGVGKSLLCYSDPTSHRRNSPVGPEKEFNMTSTTVCYCTVAGDANGQENTSSTSKQEKGAVSSSTGHGGTKQEP